MSNARSGVAVLAALVGVPEVLVAGVTGGDCWSEAVGWSGVDSTVVGVAGVGEDTDSLPVLDIFISR